MLSLRSCLISCTALLVLLAPLGCVGRELSTLEPVPAKEQQKSLPAAIQRKLDLLFVIDNSASMKEEQASLVVNFDGFMNVLSNIAGGLPDIHLGVVSTDLGGGTDGQCVGPGDDGRLIRAPRVRAGTCQGPTDGWIASAPDGHGGRVTNFPATQTLAETFGCIAELGTDGCGFEQPLEAMRRALENPTNRGFVRPDAFLMVVFITDEDDCSVFPDGGAQMFAPTSCSNYLDPSACPLGALGSFRCFEFGVECNPDHPRQVGDKESCVPRQDSPYMPGVEAYADFLRSVKGNPGLILTAGIIGPAHPVAVESAAMPAESGTVPIVELASSCASESGQASPGIRLSAFFDQFPTRSTVTSICNENLTDALLQVAWSADPWLGSTCLYGDLADRDGDPDNGIQPTCSVYDVLFPNTDDEVQGDPMPECDAERDNTPCFAIEPDPDQCGGSPSELKITIERGATEPPIGTEAQIRCVAN